MKTRSMFCRVVGLSILLSAVNAVAQVAAPATPAMQAKEGAVNSAGAGGGEKPAIEALKSQFVAAYNDGKADAIAALFAEDGRITNEEGASVEGRKAIAQRYADTFKDNPGARIELRSGSLRFLTPDVAIEEGAALVHEAEKPAIGDAAKQPAAPAQGADAAKQPAAAQSGEAARQPSATQGGETAKQTAAAQSNPADADSSAYTAILVKKNGHWLVSMLRDNPAPAAPTPTPHERLQDLKWMVGEWVEEGPDATSTSTCAWDESENFLVWKYKIQNKNARASGGTTFIGWDPLTKQITSWVFDSDGGHGEATWTQLGDDQWMAKASGILSDGRTASATQYIKRLDNNRASWTSLDRVAGGEPVPNISEYVLVRRPPQARGAQAQAEGAGEVKAAATVGASEKK